MTVPSLEPGLGVSLGLMHGGLGVVLAADGSRGSDDDLLGLLRSAEVLRRRLAVLDHAVLAELDSRGVAQAAGGTEARLSWWPTCCVCRALRQPRA